MQALILLIVFLDINIICSKSQDMKRLRTFHTTVITKGIICHQTPHMCKTPFLIVPMQNTKINFISIISVVMFA